jgi:hypothetical protein
VFPRLSTGSECQIRKTGAPAKPCSRGLYDRRSDVGLIIERRRGSPGRCSFWREGGRLFGDMADGFGFGQTDGGDLVGGEEDAVASVAAHGPYGDAFTPDASSRLIPGRLPWRPNAICFDADKGLDVRFFVSGLRSRRWLRGRFGPRLEAKGGRDEWSAEEAGGRYRGRPGSRRRSERASVRTRRPTEASRFRVTAR